MRFGASAVASFCLLLRCCCLSLGAAVAVAHGQPPAESPAAVAAHGQLPAESRAAVAHGQRPAESPASVAAESALGSQLQRLRELENEHGWHGFPLLEPVESLADRLAALGRVAEADAAYARAQQIARAADGLYTPRQIPLALKRIGNAAAAGDWETARGLQERLHRLLGSGQLKLRQVDVAHFTAAGDSHLRGALRDHYRQQGWHFRYAETYGNLALAVAGASWQPADPRLAQLPYRQLLLSHRHAVAGQVRGVRGRAARVAGDLGHGPALTAEAALALQRGKGLLHLETLRAFYLERQRPDMEGAAMVTLHCADWLLLFGREEEAIATYRAAWAELIAAGVAPERLNAMFARPAFLPIPRFAPSVDEGLAAARRGDWQATVLENRYLAAPRRLRLVAWRDERPGRHTGSPPAVGGQGRHGLASGGPANGWRVPSVPVDVLAADTDRDTAKGEHVLPAVADAPPADSGWQPAPPHDTAPASVLFEFRLTDKATERHPWRSNRARLGRPQDWVMAATGSAVADMHADRENSGPLLEALDTLRLRPPLRDGVPIVGTGTLSVAE